MFLIMNKIKELRTSKGYNQIQLAQILEVSQTSVSNWESGKYLPETDKLLKMSEIFDASVDYILGKSKYYYPEDFGKDSVITTEERQILEAYRKLTPELQKSIQNTIFTIANSVQK